MRLYFLTFWLFDVEVEEADESKMPSFSAASISNERPENNDGVFPDITDILPTWLFDAEIEVTGPESSEILYKLGRLLELCGPVGRRTSCSRSLNLPEGTLDIVEELSHCIPGCLKWFSSLEVVFSKTRCCFLPEMYKNILLYSIGNLKFGSE